MLTVHHKAGQTNQRRLVRLGFNNTNTRAIPTSEFLFPDSEIISRVCGNPNCSEVQRAHQISCAIFTNLERCHGQTRAEESGVLMVGDGITTQV